jgi:hypothetical protein
MQQSIDRSGGIHGNKGRLLLLKFNHSSGFVDASKSNGPSAGAMQLEEGSHLELKE